MGSDQIKAFVDKARNDSNLKQKLTRLPAQESEAVKEIVKIANSAGYQFNEKDWYDTHKKMVSSGEISQEDLDKVSGGTIVTLTIIIITPPIVGTTLTVCRQQ